MAIAAPRSFARLVCLSVVVAGPAVAETQAEKDACTPDVWRLCAGQIPNVDEIVACLERKLSKLSPACRVVMQGGKPDRARRDRHSSADE